MKKLIMGVAAAAGALTLATAGPAAATEQLCQTNENAPFYQNVNNDGGVGYLFTLSGGRGFRATGLYSDAYQRLWVYGHGAEHPDREGWVLQAHTNCCPGC